MQCLLTERRQRLFRGRILQNSGPSVPLSIATQAGLPPASILAAPRLLRAFLLIASLALLVLLTACAGSRGGPIAYEPTDFGAPDTPAVVPLDQDYKIAPLDTLKISVFQVADLTGEYEVDLTGHVAMPLLGNVMATNLTTSDLDRRLTEKLGERYLQNPYVSVGITKSSSRVVTVDGSVRQPGMFPIGGNTTLMQVVAMARGTDDNAN